ncbi:MAG: Hsp20/alpha crystallin family protein [Holophagales bacterium]|nr:MAG: Hsp20/alpha crystallin family protein [Holophagales bacterium]
MSTTLTRWTPTADPFRDRVNRMFDDFLRDLVPARNSEEMSGGRWLPAVDIKESPEALMLTVELPGLKKEEVSITLENQVLTIHGERKFEGETKDATYHRIERAYGSFMRSFTLPANIKTDRVDASFDSGLLTVTLPKVEEAKPRRIEIK